MTQHSEPSEMRVHAKTSRPGARSRRPNSPAPVRNRAARAAVGRVLRSASGGGGDAVSGSEQTAARIREMQGGGVELGDREREFFEPRLGRELGHVRIHDHAGAAAVARVLRADAFTVGRDIFFGRGNYRPDTRQGRSLIAHELAHVAQQGVRGPGPMLVQRHTTRGAGGCGPPRDIDEDLSGARGAGLTAHRQIQTYLLRHNRISNELGIPRATKRRMGSHGCQSSRVRMGSADLWKQGMRIGLGEIKPFGFAATYAVEEVEHYIRRARQSADRLFSRGPCGPRSAGRDDRVFARRIGMGQVRKQFTKLRGILPTDTIIGTFIGDRSRTLKARMVAPGAVGYWCTGGRSNTHTCGVSDEETNRFLDQAMVPAQDAVDRFIEQRFERPLERAITNFDVGRVLVMARRRFGPQILRALGPYLGPVSHLVPSDRVLRYVGDILARQLGPTARSVIMTVARYLKTLILNELRIRLRDGLRTLLRQVLLTICVGVPVVTLSKLLDELNKRLMDEAKRLAPAILTAVGVALAAALLRMLGQILSEVYNAVARVVSAIFDVIKRIFAVVAIVLLVVVAIILFVVAFALIFDVAPGDEAAVALAGVALLALIPPLARFVATGSTSEAPDA